MPTIEGLTGDTALLETKMVFDGFATLVFAASLGEGVLFSAIPIFIFQGALAMLANVFSPIFLPAGCEYENVFNVPLSKVVSGCIMGRKMIDEMTAVGGVLIMAMGIKVSGLKEDLSVENFLPAIFLAIVLTPIFARLM